MRRLEDHTSPQELASLPRVLDALGSDQADEQQLLLHLRGCQQCTELAQTHAQLRNLGPTAGSEDTKNCPEPSVWLEFAAALSPEQSAHLLDHAAHCSACAYHLRESMELMQSSQLDPDTANLGSATPEWQR